MSSALAPQDSLILKTLVSAAILAVAHNAVAQMYADHVCPTIILLIIRALAHHLSLLLMAAAPVLQEKLSMKVNVFLVMLISV